MRFVLSDRQPLVIGAGTVEAGENDCTLVECSDDRKQLGQCWKAAEQARGDDRIARTRATPDRGLALEQPIPPLGRIERPLFSQYPRPVLRQDLQKVKDNLPMLGQVLRNEVIDLLEARSF